MSALPHTSIRSDERVATDTPAELRKRLSEARLEVEAAYADARRVVYDRLPAGPVAGQVLTPLQQAALHRLDVAERNLDALRHLSHRSGRSPVIQLD